MKITLTQQQVCGTPAPALPSIYKSKHVSGTEIFGEMSMLRERIKSTCETPKSRAGAMRNAKFHYNSKK